MSQIRANPSFYTVTWLEKAKVVISTWATSTPSRNGFTWTPSPNQMGRYRYPPYPERQTWRKGCNSPTSRRRESPRTSRRGPAMSSIPYGTSRCKELACYNGYARPRSVASRLVLGLTIMTGNKKHLPSAAQSCCLKVFCGYSWQHWRQYYLRCILRAA